MALKSILSVASLLLILGASSSSCQDVQIPETPLFPLKEGNQWHYRVVPIDSAKGPRKGKDEDPARKVVVRVDKLVYFEVTRNGKEEKIPAYKLIGVSGDNELSEHVSVQADGVYKYAGGDKDITAPLCILKLGIKEGDSWECNVPVEGGVVKGIFTVSREKVSVPAGNFNALKVSGHDFTIGSRKMSIDYWFAEGKGIVKQVTRFGTLTVIQELEKFVPAGSNTL